MKAFGAVLLGLGLATAAEAMSVAEFLGRADALRAKGAMALFSGSEIKRLKDEVVGAVSGLRDERLAAERAGRTPAYCPPAKGGLSSTEMLDAFRALPSEQRARLSLRGHFRRKFPCGAG